MIQLQTISKSFGSVQVLNNVTLNFKQGTTTALLGPNGSGKTTIIKTILGLVKPESGMVHVNNQPVNNTWQYRASIGYMPQIARYPDNLAVRELLDMIADLRNENPALSDELIHEFELEPHCEKPMRSLSGGTRQKVSAVAALMFDAPILILDEPTAGLDPVMARRLKDFVRKEQANGKTILLTTHVLAEIEELADDVAFLLEGDVVFQGSRHQLLDEAGTTDFERAITTLLSQRRIA